MLPKVALTDISAWDVAWPAATGLGLGLGARLLRHGYDLKTKRGLRAPKEAPAVESAQIEVPVEVSEEEANELKRQGLKVGSALDASTPRPGKGPARQVLPKAQPTNSTSMPSSTAPVVKLAVAGLVANVAQGLLGAGAAYGGWKMLDDKLDEDRVAKAKASLNRSRERVKRLIAGEPDPSEVGAAAAMKTAEELFMKEAIDLLSSVGSGLVGGAMDLMAPIGIPLGIGAALIGAKSYNDAKRANKYRQRIKQITESLEGETPSPPMAVLHPILRKKSPAVAGVDHNPGAEPAPSPELDLNMKAAAQRRSADEEDDEDTDYGKWIALALAGAAGVAGVMWVRSNPDVAKQYAPWASGLIDMVSSGKELTPEQKAAADAKAKDLGATPQDVTAGQAAAKSPEVAAAVQEPTKENIQAAAAVTTPAPKASQDAILAQAAPPAQSKPVAVPAPVDPGAPKSTRLAGSLQRQDAQLAAPPSPEERSVGELPPLGAEPPKPTAVGAVTPAAPKSVAVAAKPAPLPSASSKPAVPAVVPPKPIGV